MFTFDYNPKDSIVTIANCSQINIEELYAELKSWSGSEVGMPFIDTVERNKGYEIYGGKTTDYIVVLQGDWRIYFDNKTDEKEFEIINIFGGILVKKDRGNPYIEKRNQFIQNLIKMHTKFPELPATEQIEIDFYRLTHRENPISSISLAYFDIDNFKRFNTDYGEKNVDSKVLSPFHSWLTEKTYGRACAYIEGGDEFIILLPGMDSENSKIFCQELVREIENRNFVIDEKDENFTVSMGLTTLREEEELEDFVQRANLKKNDAKKNGKNRLEIG